MKIRYVLPFANALLLALLFYIHSAPQQLAHSAEGTEGQLVTRVYIIRRPLEGAPFGSVGPLAHSGLLLQTKAGEHYVLEYMDDSRVHLTAGTPEEQQRNARRKVAIIKMNGVASGRVASFEWERQLRGLAIDPKWTPQQLHEKMQSLMAPYSLWRAENCHQAQERLREWLLKGSK